MINNPTFVFNTKNSVIVGTVLIGTNSFIKNAVEIRNAVIHDAYIYMSASSLSELIEQIKNEYDVLSCSELDLSDYERHVLSNRFSLEREYILTRRLPELFV